MTIRSPTILELLVILFEVMFSPSNSQYIVAAGIPVAVHVSSSSEPSTNVYVMFGAVNISTAAVYSNEKEKHEMIYHLVLSLSPHLIIAL